MSSSAFSLSAIVPETAFEIIEGEPVPGGRDPAVGHMFCPECMTWLYTKGPWLVGYVNLRPTMLDDTTWLAPFIETCVAEKLSFATTGASHSFAGFPSMEEFESLLAKYAEYAEWASE